MMGRRTTSENPAEQETPDTDFQQPEEAADEQSPEPTSGLTRANVAAATHVAYVGLAHVREISAADWKNIGVEGQAKVVWDRRNPLKNRVPLSELTPDAVVYLDQMDDGFVLLDENGKRV
jgi:hypothetical protein